MQTKEEQQKEELAQQGEPWEIKLPFDEIPEHEHSVYYYDKSVHTTLRQLDDTNLVHDVYEKYNFLLIINMLYDVQVIRRVNFLIKIK